MNYENVIQTYKGNLFDFEELDGNVVDIEDIAHSLSNQCRWTGHTICFFSIAEHSCRVHDRVLFDTGDRVLAAEGLVHDAPEAFFLDIPRPLKRLLGDYLGRLEHGEEYVMGQLGLPHKLSPEVALVDNRMLSTEYLQLIDCDNIIRVPIMMDYMREFPPYDKAEVNLSTVWTPYRAEQEFLNRWRGYENWKENQ